MLKSTINVEKIPVLVKSKIISEKKGLQLVVQVISQDPAEYLLNPKNYELISDIIPTKKIVGVMNLSFI